MERPIRTLVTMILVLRCSSVEVIHISDVYTSRIMNRYYGAAKNLPEVKLLLKKEPEDVGVAGGCEE